MGGNIINRIVDTPEVMEAWCRFEIRNLGLFQSKNGLLYLSLDEAQQSSSGLPLVLGIVRYGPRCGWKWIHCEVHWINGEPRPDENGYDEVCPRSGGRDEFSYSVPPYRLHYELHWLRTC